jgi:hypothetical protein
MIKTLHSFLLESFLSTIKHNCHLFVPSLLIESLRPIREPSCTVRSAVVLTRTWDFKFETLSKEDLVEIEARRRSVKSYFLSCSLLEV